MLNLTYARQRSLVKRLFFFFLFFLTMYASSAVFAAVFIRAGATGNGADWENALPSLPVTLIRGETYYIASGNYPSYKVDDTVNGNLLITIKKATVLEHGCTSLCGWNDSYATGQAVFAAPFNIITSYILFDGVVGSGSDPATYGFKIAATNCAIDNNSMLGIPPMGYSGLTLSDITIAHVSLIHCGSGYDTEQRGIYSLPASATNMLVTYNYVKDASTNMLLRWAGGEVSNNYFAGNWSSPYSHGQQMDFVGPSSNVTVKNNTFKDSTVFAIMTHNANNNYYKIYNNIFIGGSTTGIISIDPSSTDSGKQWHVYNNTFSGVTSAGYGAFAIGTLTDPNTYRSYFYNNLFYATSYPNLTPVTAGSIIHDYNAWIDCTNVVSTEMHGQIGTGNPFVNSAIGDYHLKAQTNAGKTDLGSPFNVDRDGRPRMFWNRGAYEYKAPSLPTDLSIQ